MYTEGILSRYADSLPDPEAREKLHAVIRGIQFDTENGVRICSGDIGKSFDKAGMSAAFADLNARLGGIY